MVYFQISPVGFDCGKDKNNCDKYPDFCKECVKTQFETLKIPNVFNQSSMWNSVMEQLIFEDRVLVEESMYNGYMEYQNEQGQMEIKWMEPCTQKYIYSKLE